MFPRLSTFLSLEFNGHFFFYGLILNYIMVYWFLLSFAFLRSGQPVEKIYRIWHAFPRQVQAYSSAYSWCLYCKGTTRICRFWILLHSHNFPWVLPWDWAPYYHSSKWSKFYSQIGQLNKIDLPFYLRCIFSGSFFVFAPIYLRVELISMVCHLYLR